MHQRRKAQTRKHQNRAGTGKHRRGIGRTETSRLASSSSNRITQFVDTDVWPEHFQAIGCFERMAAVVDNPQRFIDTYLLIPNIQTCVALILYHPSLAIAIHANHPNHLDPAMDDILARFDANEINPSEIQATMIGGYHRYTDDGCFAAIAARLGSWSGLTSCSIARIIQQKLRAAGIAMQPEEIHRTSWHEGNYCAQLNLTTGKIKAFYSTNEFEDLPFMITYQKKYPDLIERAVRLTGNTRDPYQFYQYDNADQLNGPTITEGQRDTRCPNSCAIM